MEENKAGFLPPGVNPGAGNKEFIKGQKAINAAKGSGQRAEEARQQAVKETKEKLEAEIREFEREGADPNKLRKLRRKLDNYGRLKEVKR